MLVIIKYNQKSWFWRATQCSFISQFSSVQPLSCVRLFATPWTAAHHASLSITNSRSPPKPMSIVSVMPSNHLILCCPLLLPPSIFPSIRVFSNESALHIHRLIKLRVKLGYHYFFIKFLKWLLFAIRIERAMAMGWTESTDMCRIFLALSCYVL